MKSFSNFLKEATETSASRQAKLLGLVGDGHGGWYDAKGNFAAKTEKGKLKFYGKGGKAPEEEGASRKKGKEVETKNRKPAAQVASQQPTKKVEPEGKKGKAPADETGEGSSGVVIVFGRFNPPTVGHQKLLQSASAEANKQGYDLKIYPSRTQDAKKNPLDPGVKIHFMKKMFPDFEENIINDSDTKTIFDALVSAYGDQYANVTIVVGQDRLSEFQGLAQKYNGSDLYNFNEIIVVSGGARDPDAEDVTGMSASKLRSFASEDNFESFAKGLPESLKNMEKREIYNAVRSAMGVKSKGKEKEVAELWQIAPKLDQETLRETYLSGKIFRLGDIVENLNTGLVGKIIRRGTSYLICVTENNVMFKSWLKDLVEYTEVKMDRLMRDKKHPNTLVGTRGLFKYARRMTAGSEKGITVSGQYK